MGKGVGDSEIVQICYSIDHDQDYDGFEESPFFDHFENLVQCRFVSVVSFLLLDYSSNLRHILFSIVENSDLHQNLLCLLLLIVIHQNER